MTVRHLWRESERFRLLCKAHDLRPAQVGLLLTLSEMDGVSMQTIAASMDRVAPTITRLVAPMEVGGWVSTTRGEDARARLVSLTEAGWTKVRALAGEK